MQLFPHAAPVTVCNAATQGTLYYDGNEIYMCTDTDPTGGVIIGWQRIDPPCIRYNYGPGTVNPFGVCPAGYALASLIYNCDVTHPSDGSVENILPQAGQYLCCRFCEDVDFNGICD